MTTRSWTIIYALYSTLTLLHPISSLSSHSPPDPFAYPKYSVSLLGWEDAINNLTATEILSHLQSQSQARHDGLINPNSFSPNNEPTVRNTLMRTASGQAFLCALPPITSPPVTSNSPPVNTTQVDSPSSGVEDLERKKERDQIEQEGLKNGLNLISSLKDRCIYAKLGWFTYSFCYGKGEIRQFHAQIVPGYNSPQEDPSQDVYVLGFHIGHPQNPHHQAKLEGTLPAPTLSAGEGELTSLGRSRFSSSGGSMLGSISDVLRDESTTKSSGAQEEEEFQQKRYLVQRWDGGTICDMTGKPRSVEVQFHCSTLGSDHIALLRETTICEYLLVIHTPRLCSEPLFLDGGSRKGIGGGEVATDIGCRPVLTDEEIEKWQANQSARKKKKQDSENAQKLKSLEETPSGQKINAESQDLTRPDIIPQDPTVEPANSDMPSSDSVPGVSESPGESIPIGSPDQIVLGGTESTVDQATGKADSKSPASKTDEKPSHSKEKSGILEVEPITVYFDTDSGKVYVDNPAAEKGPSGHGSTDTQSGTTTDRNNHQGTNADQRITRSKTESPPQQANYGDPRSEFQEIAKALKESLTALLKDLRADDEANNEAARRLNQNHRNQAQPKSVAEVLASIKKEMESPSSGSTIRKTRTTQSNPQFKTRVEDLKKLSTESHSKLVERYQQKFDIPDQSNSNEPPAVANDEKQPDDKGNKVSK